MKNKKKLSNKVAIITGAAKGIGKAIALLFAEEGASVVLNVFSSYEEGKIIASLINSNGKATCIKADISKTGDVQRLVKETIEEYGKIDIIVNNSGIGSQNTPDIVTDISENDWDRVFDVNVKAVMLLCKYFFPYMIKNGGGSVINISSIRGILGNPNLASYCSSKGALVILSKQMALDYAKHNIRVNCICPGFINTEMFEGYLKKQDDPVKAKQVFAEMCPMNRIGEPIEVAKAALFLASDFSSFITGATLPVDGGYVSYGTRKIK